MRIGTWNVNGIRARADQFLEWVTTQSPDIACIQETKASPDQVPAHVKDIDGYWSFWHEAKKGYSGVALLLSKKRFPEPPRFGHPPADMESRVVEAVSGNLRIASVYMPNGGKDYDAKIKFYRAMLAHIQERMAAGDQWIIAGDMNIALTDKDVHPSQQKEGTIGQRPEERVLLQSMIDFGLVDVTRVIHPDDDRFFTWWPYWREARRKNLGWRIDAIYASRALNWNCKSCEVMREFGTSDHAPLMADFDS
jgi:exodeoxyribonuclease-3